MPILALDMYEHAYHIDFGAAAAAYVDAFMANIDWAGVYARYQAAVHAASEPFGATQDDVAGALLLDVRRAGVFDRRGTMIPGARWCDPAGVATGPASCRPIATWSCTASTATRSAAPPRCGCAPPA